MQTPVTKKPPTGNRRGRPRATEVIAKTNHKVDQFFQKKAAQADASMPLQPVEEEKEQLSQPTEVQLPPSSLRTRAGTPVTSECRSSKNPSREPS